VIDMRKTRKRVKKSLGLKTKTKVRNMAKIDLSEFKSARGEASAKKTYIAFSQEDEGYAIIQRLKSEGVTDMKGLVTTLMKNAGL